MAGRFPLRDTAFQPIYRSPTHALHLYEYDCTMRFGSRPTAIRAGDLTLSPASKPTSYDLPHPGKHLCVHFWPAERLWGFRTAAWAHLPLHARLGPLRTFAAQKLLELIRLQSRRTDDPVVACAASAVLLELLLWLAGLNQPNLRITRRADRAIEAAADFIEGNIDHPLRVPDVARAVGLSQNYLARRFRDRFGRTIPSYVLLRRIEVARHLLATTNLSVKEVGAQAGLPDPQHFNKQFRRYTGENPSAYRDHETRLSGRIRVPPPTQ
jgi:AraC-like DNA-binding protein